MAEIRKVEDLREFLVGREGEIDVFGVGKGVLRSVDDSEYWDDEGEHPCVLLSFGNDDE